MTFDGRARLMLRSSDYGVFVREFFRHFHTTGAILPSGPWLARALVSYLDEPVGKRRILEVGPGTGAVTGHIVAALKPEDHLDLVELNGEFVRQLERRFAEDARFRPAADRTRIHHCAIEELDAAQRYDSIVSGLPLNNFSATQVEQILAILMARLKPGGVLSFFEYIAIRRLKTLFSGRLERQRLREVTGAIHRLLARSEIRRNGVWFNVPPAWVHHVRAS